MVRQLGSAALPRMKLAGEAERSYLLLKTDLKESSIRLLETLRNTPGVLEVGLSKGDYSFVVATFGDKKNDDRIRGIKGVKEVHTTTVGRADL